MRKKEIIVSHCVKAGLTDFDRLDVKTSEEVQSGNKILVHPLTNREPGNA